MPRVAEECGLGADHASQPSVRIVIVARDNSAGGIADFPDAAEMISGQIARRPIVRLAVTKKAIHLSSRETFFDDVAGIPEQLGIPDCRAAVLLDDASPP